MHTLTRAKLNTLGTANRLVSNYALDFAMALLHERSCAWYAQAQQDTARGGRAAARPRCYFCVSELSAKLATKERFETDPKKCEDFYKCALAYLPGLGRNSGTEAKRGRGSLPDYDLLLIPFHFVSAQHWCLAAVFLKDHLIRVYDSISGTKMMDSCLPRLATLLQRAFKEVGGSFACFFFWLARSCASGTLFLVF